MRPLRFPGQAQGLIVHEGEHQDGIGLVILDDHRDQTVFVELDRERPHLTGLTGTPCSARNAFRSAIRSSPKWKRDAASTASALPGRSASAKCSRVPAPPDAIRGTSTVDPIAWRSST